MSRGYGWRGGCLAAAVSDGDVGSVGCSGLIIPKFELRERFSIVNLDDRNS